MKILFQTFKQFLVLRRTLSKQHFSQLAASSLLHAAKTLYSLHNKRKKIYKLWAESDLNQRRRAPADLQSAPVDHFGIGPYLYFFYLYIIFAFFIFLSIFKCFFTTFLYLHPHFCPHPRPKRGWTGYA